jgi:hypothetical protein
MGILPTLRKIGAKPASDSEMESRRKSLEKKLLVPKIFFVVLFAAVFLVASKTKMFPIFGTDLNFSIGAMFGPTLGALLGINLGIASILLADAIGFLIGMYTFQGLASLFTFAPAVIASVYFARSFKSDIKTVIIPLASMVLFWAHPIGREVWYYALFWSVPALTVIFKKQIDSALKHPVAKIYAQSLGAAFTDHAIGSVVYMYLLNIPAQFWIAAIPMTVVERLIIALGIDFSYLGVKKAMKALQDAMVLVANQVPVSNAHKEGIKVSV